jgi:hypothetical protein
MIYMIYPVAHAFSSSKDVLGDPHLAQTLECRGDSEGQIITDPSGTE